MPESTQVHLTLSAEEQQYLIALLESALGEGRSEVHHTRTTEFRQRLHDELAMIRSLLTRLRGA